MRPRDRGFNELTIARGQLTFTTSSSKRRKVAERKAGARGRPASSSLQGNNPSTSSSSPRLRRRASGRHRRRPSLPTAISASGPAATSLTPTAATTPTTTGPRPTPSDSIYKNDPPISSSGPRYNPPHPHPEIRRRKKPYSRKQKLRSAASQDTAIISRNAASAEGQSTPTTDDQAPAGMSAPDSVRGPLPPLPDDGSENDRQEFQSTPAVKRPAAEMGEDDRPSLDVEMGSDSFDGNEDQNKDQSSNGKKQMERPTRQRRAVSVDMVGQNGTITTTNNSMVGTEMKPGSAKCLSMEDANSSSSDSVYPTPSSMSTYTSYTREDAKPRASSHATHDRPPIDEQVAAVTKLLMQPLKDQQKGYVVSANWLGRVLSRSSKGGLQREKADKTASEGEIGAVDNSDLVLVTDPSIMYKDEAGEPFVPLRPGLQMGEDFEILPEDAWELIMKWYGLSPESPAIIRYAHNTTVGSTEHVQYELNPPIFTILKLPNPSLSPTQIAQDRARVPIKTLASRHTQFQQWLRNVKDLASIEMSTKVRVWRILEGLNSTTTSGIITPAASRSASPAPGATLTASAGNSFLLDVNKFVALVEGSQRELLEMKDQTSNPKYNGSLTLHLAGLGSDDVIVLEEQVGGPAGGEWISDGAGKSSNRLAVTTHRAGPQNKGKGKLPTASGRASPAIGAVSRGRPRKDGRSLGVTGLSNLGNSCYMNSALQCVRSVEELTQYFLQDEYRKDLNPGNPLSHDGNVAKAYANLLHQLYDDNGTSSFAPRQFKQTIGRYGPSFSGYGQQDSQEFVLFLLDGLQEDLNRIQKKPYIEKPDSTDDMVGNNAALQEFANKCWEIYKARNDSVITDLFAGMYKSTVVCPVCDKVSIIFDPFSNLTLQLPIENLWSKEIFFFPLHSRPIRVAVDIDKNASIKALKEYVGQRVGVPTNRLVMAEIYKHKFYKMFENTSSIGECQIGSSDDIGIFELESVPTSYDPDKAPSRSVYSSLAFSHSNTTNQEIPSFDSPKCDRMIIPIFNRVIKPQGAKITRQLFGAPSYTIITRKESYDYDSILRKVLRNVANLTTRDILREDEGDIMMNSSAAEDSDTVVTNDDDFDSSDPKIKASSVDGEDGLVDVSMRDGSDSSTRTKSSVKGDTTPIPKVLRPNNFIPPMLRNLFEIKIMRSTDAVPTGWSTVDEIKEFTSMTSRLPRKQAKRTTTKKSPVSRGSSPLSSEDELSGPARRVDIARSRDNNDDSDGCSSQKTKESGTESGSDSYPGPSALLHGAGRRKLKPSTSKKGPPEAIPLIRSGEGIVLDWNEHAYDGLFAGDPLDDDGLRGSATWMSIDCLPDPELEQKRQLRQTRKKRGISLGECLDEFGKEEILSENDAWYCPRCREHRRASKKFELWKCPDILVMHLKRFSANRGFRDKIDALVDFPLELDMSGRVQMPEEGKSLQYELIAVDNHYGGLGGGHYTAYAKNFFDGCWYEYNACITEAAKNPEHDDSDSQPDSRTLSPSGEDLRLGGSSRNGSSSALIGAGAIHQAGAGGLRGGIQARDDDSLPEYSELHHHNHLEGMDLEDEGFGSTFGPDLNFSNHPSWSFDRAAEPYGGGVSGLVPAPANSFYDGDGDDDLDDEASNKAVGGGDMSDSESRLAMLNDSGDQDGLIFEDADLSSSTTAVRNIMQPPDLEDDDDSMPVVELRVPEEEGPAAL
ncbi:ubiquitin carboxyl-terminal hydrolase [Histoplasma capsulatum var. duboisii H88]|uniref:ubiquitinyl hydrolase 1 n=1 Tax=Ajellomyces capsulatus (strain H88) TaxID=544711 RepID=F0UKF9_AJEC8|nr:ubiquitin carboxyl-terminal hydrolase [Histoplasma capsulatum var. duboisii H88]